MPKFYCAQCGAELETMLRAIPQQGIVITVVKPHSCEETKEEDKFDLKGMETHRTTGTGKAHSEEVEKPKPKLDFDFVSKLNKAIEIEPMIAGSGDLRPKSSRREELKTSTAPLSILNKAPREAGVTPPADDEKEFEDG